MYIKPPHWDLLVIGGDIAEMYSSGVSHKLSTSVACHVKSSWMMAFSLNFLLAKAKNHARVVSSKTARFAKGRSASGRSCMIASPKLKEMNKQSPFSGVSILSTLDIWILAKRPPIMPPGAGVSSNPLACRAFRRTRNSLSEQTRSHMFEYQKQCGAARKFTSFRNSTLSWTINSEYYIKIN